MALERCSLIEPPSGAPPNLFRSTGLAWVLVVIPGFGAHHSVLFPLLTRQVARAGEGEGAHVPASSMGDRDVLKFAFAAAGPVSEVQCFANILWRVCHCLAGQLLAWEKRKYIIWGRRGRNQSPSSACVSCHPVGSTADRGSDRSARPPRHLGGT